jgi:hypothetical protein
MQKLTSALKFRTWQEDRWNFLCMIDDADGFISLQKRFYSLPFLCVLPIYLYRITSRNVISGSFTLQLPPFPVIIHQLLLKFILSILSSFRSTKIHMTLYSCVPTFTFCTFLVFWGRLFRCVSTTVNALSCTLRITGFLDFVHRPELLITKKHTV